MKSKYRMTVYIDGGSCRYIKSTVEFKRLAPNVIEASINIKHPAVICDVGKKHQLKESAGGMYPAVTAGFSHKHKLIKAYRFYGCDWKKSDHFFKLLQQGKHGARIVVESYLTHAIGNFFRFDWSKVPCGKPKRFLYK